MEPAPKSASVPFLHFSPTQHWKDVTIPATNGRLTAMRQLTHADFVMFIALRLFVSCHCVGDVKGWGSSAPPSATGAPRRLGMFTSGRQFIRISAALAFTLTAVVCAPDSFHAEQRQQGAWNQNVEHSWDPGWLACMDEGMTWNAAGGIPGGMHVPRKFWTEGNEHHTLADHPAAIATHDEIVMGKDRQVRLVEEFEDVHGPGVVAIVLRCCKCMKGSGRVAMLDSGFCVLLLIAALGKFGLSPSAP